MLEALNEQRNIFDGRVPDASAVDHLSALRRQYARAREYCGFTLDELINNRAAKRTLREIWLLGCMVRKPAKALRLPAGNPFSENRLVAMPSSQINPGRLRITFDSRND
jgi:hypothetical protein